MLVYADLRFRTSLLTLVPKSLCCFSMLFIRLLIIDSSFVNIEFHYPIHMMTFFIEMKNLHNVFNFPRGVIIF